MTTLEIVPNNVISVLLMAGGWVDGVLKCTEVDLTGIGATGKAVKGFELLTNSGPIYAPATAVVGVRTRDRVLTAEEVQAERAAELADYAEAHSRQHYIGPEEAAQLLTSQDGLCASCHVPLADVPGWHLFEGNLRCAFPRGTAGCSPLRWLN